jgi:hypothetical protein
MRCRVFIKWTLPPSGSLKLSTLPCSGLSDPRGPTPRTIGKPQKALPEKLTFPRLGEVDFGWVLPQIYFLFVTTYLVSKVRKEKEEEG